MNTIITPIIQEISANTFQKDPSPGMEDAKFSKDFYSIKIQEIRANDEDEEVFIDDRLTRHSSSNSQKDQEFLFNSNHDQLKLQNSVSTPNMEIIPENMHQIENTENQQNDSPTSPQVQDIVSLEVRVEPNPIVEAQQETSEELLLWQSQSRLFLKKMIASSLTIFLLLLAALVIDHTEDDYAWFFEITDVYYMYCSYIEYFLAKKIFGEVWAMTKHISELINIALFSISPIFIYLKFFKVISFSLYSCLPFQFAIIFLLIFAPASFKDRIRDNVFRSYLLVQLVLVSLKIDEFITCDWDILFIVSFIYLSKGSILSLKYAFSFLKMIRSVINKTINVRDAENKKKIIGFFWCSLYYGLNISTIFGLLGIGRAFNSEVNQDFTLLKIAACFGLINSILLFICTLLAKEILIQFIIEEKVIESYLFGNPYFRNSQPNKIITFEVEKKEEFFMMISSTYFTPLQDDSRLKEKVKKISNNSSANPISPIEEEEFEAIKEDLQMNQKLITDRGEGISSPNAKEEKSCYICYENQPDAIFLGCGHGGVCFECTVPIVKNKDECMQCRKKVDAIFKIQPEPVISNIYKGIELHKLVKTTDSK